MSSEVTVVFKGYYCGSQNVVHKVLWSVVGISYLFGYQIKFSIINLCVSVFYFVDYQVTFMGNTQIF